MSYYKIFSQNQENILNQLNFKHFNSLMLSSGVWASTCLRSAVMSHAFYVRVEFYLRPFPETCAHVYVWRKRLISIKRKRRTPIENGWEEPHKKKKIIIAVPHFRPPTPHSDWSYIFYCPPFSRTIRSLSVFKGMRTKSYLIYLSFWLARNELLPGLL